MAAPFLFTKSDFVYALDCATKQYYRDRYPLERERNDFLQQLVDGGIQTGALARAYFPEGVLCVDVDHDRAVERTRQLLAEDEVIIFEAAFRFDQFFIRIDVLRKSEGVIDLIEVKSKSCDEKPDLTKKNGDIRPEWTPLIHEVAFQLFVASSAYPDLVFRPKVMLFDKSRRATVDGLLRALPIDPVSRSCELRRELLGPDGIGERLLEEFDVASAVELVRSSGGSGDAIASLASRLADARTNAVRSTPAVVKHCKECEWRAPFIVGFEPVSGCWSELLAADPIALAGAPIFQINNYRGWDDDVRAGRYLLEHVETSALNPRQQLQVDVALGLKGPEVVDPALFDELAEHNYPLYFIDFEAWGSAIPAHRNRQPCSNLIFQFSCHRMDRDGTVIHHAEWLNPDSRDFPNYECIRALRRAIGEGPGSVFQYSPYENTQLNHVRRQLLDDRKSVADADELIAWIETLTRSSSERRAAGPRALIDLCDLVKRFYYHERMLGSNSIKQVLHACLGASAHLRELYSRPYTSANYAGQIWWQEGEEGWPKYPYELLERISIEGHEIAPGEDDDDSLTVADGGAAIVAYSRLHFVEPTSPEALQLRASLLRYCELDTLAMVMIYQHWLSLRLRA